MGTMRGFLTFIKDNWQPILVFSGAGIAAIGTVATVYCLTAWLAPALSIWPAAIVAGVLLSFAALKLGSVAIVEEPEA